MKKFDRLLEITSTSEELVAYICDDVGIEKLKEYDIEKWMKSFFQIMWNQYFCKLCRRYDVTERLAHLVNFHKAKQQATSRSGFRELLDIIFVENQRWKEKN